MEKGKIKATAKNPIAIFKNREKYLSVSSFSVI
jgi:hypothetical protein